jgi:hypothetical protein
MKTTLHAFALLGLLIPASNAALIVNVVETGGDNEATDTVPAKWTGVSFVGGVVNEPVPGLAAGASYTVGTFGNHAPCFVDRNHRYTNASDTLPIPTYLNGKEYIMSGNDNRDNGTYTLDVTVSAPVRVYMLIDNRLGDGTNTLNSDPPLFSPTKMQWILDQGWTAVKNGANRAANPDYPDEVAIDEGADGTVNQWYSIYSKDFPAGTFTLRQADNAGQNMYGAVVEAAQVNIPPSFKCGPAQTIAEDSGPQTVANWALDITAGEAGQTVQFLVSNDNPSLFSAQPAISPTGTLTYTPAPNACGVAAVTAVAKDNGGGQDTSAACTINITVSCGNDCPIVSVTALSTLEDTALALANLATDPDGNPISYSFSQPAHGTISGTAPNFVYTPAQDFNGSDSFSFTADDGQCVTPGTVTVTIQAVNDAPTARILASPLADLSPELVNPVLIAPNGSNAVIHLDGSLSSDVESPNSSLTAHWILDAAPVPFATGFVTDSTLELGTHTIVLNVTDPDGASGSATLTVEVLSGSEVLEELIALVDSSDIERKNKRPFIATLKAVVASSERGQLHTAANQLHAFQNKVRAQVGPANPVEAAEWIRLAQDLIDAFEAQ